MDLDETLQSDGAEEGVKNKNFENFWWNRSRERDKILTFLCIFNVRGHNVFVLFLSLSVRLSVRLERC